MPDDNTTNQNPASSTVERPAATEKSAGALTKQELKIRGLSVAAAASAGAEFVATDARALSAKATKQARKAAKAAAKESTKAAKAMQKAAAAAQKSAAKKAKQVAKEATEFAKDATEFAKDTAASATATAKTAATKAKGLVTAPPAEAEVAIASFTVAQLREIAKERGVTGYSRLTKAELLASLR